MNYSVEQLDQKIHEACQAIVGADTLIAAMNWFVTTHLARGASLSHALQIAIDYGMDHPCHHDYKWGDMIEGWRMGQVGARTPLEIPETPVSQVGGYVDYKDAMPLVRHELETTEWPCNKNGCTGTVSDDGICYECDYDLGDYDLEQYEEDKRARIAEQNEY